ncbi:MAG TPA: hypothetical protein VFM82_01050 [Flavobacteriaceae bacterium]|nr:hypothetical protein [Flavobacteriaceae bacterium]
MSREMDITKSILEECKMHLARMEYAYSKISFLIPLNGKKIEGLSQEEITHIDQYIFRFSKLQVAIGQKLFKAVLSILGEPVENKAFIDIFNRLEQLGIIENHVLWQELRIIRNEASHEYGEDSHELAEKLTALLNAKDSLKNYLESIVNYLKNRKF